MNTQLANIGANIIGNQLGYPWLGVGIGLCLGSIIVAIRPT
jgi:hypothetical protein